MLLLLWAFSLIKSVGRSGVRWNSTSIHFLRFCNNLLSYSQRSAWAILRLTTMMPFLFWLPGFCNMFLTSSSLVTRSLTNTTTLPIRKPRTNPFRLSPFPTILYVSMNYELLACHVSPSPKDAGNFCRKTKQNEETHFCVAQERDDGNKVSRDANQSEKYTSANGEVEHLVGVFWKKRLYVVTVVGGRHSDRGVSIVHHEGAVRRKCRRWPIRVHPQQHLIHHRFCS